MASLQTIKWQDKKERVLIDKNRTKTNRASDWNWNFSQGVEMIGHTLRKSRSNINRQSLKWNSLGTTMETWGEKTCWQIWIYERWNSHWVMESTWKNSSRYRKMEIALKCPRSISYQGWKASLMISCLHNQLFFKFVLDKKKVNFFQFS